jgi:hypothetical protein
MITTARNHASFALDVVFGTPARAAQGKVDFAGHKVEIDSDSQQKYNYEGLSVFLNGRKVFK